MTLMHKAAKDDNNYILTYLREKHGMTVDLLDQDISTPLHLACQEGCDYSAFFLIGFGADVNAQNKVGDTPLHLLLRNSKKLRGSKTIRELIFKGADKEMLNKLKMKPTDYID